MIIISLKIKNAPKIFKNYYLTEGAIQILRNTLQGERGPTKCHLNIFCFLNPDCNAFGSENSCLR